MLSCATEPIKVVMAMLLAIVVVGITSLALVVLNKKSKDTTTTFQYIKTNDNRAIDAINSGDISKVESALKFEVSQYCLRELYVQSPFDQGSIEGNQLIALIKPLYIMGKGQPLSAEAGE
ncbi:hypothetical protein DID80_05425 [Candidatus Marinamargulisbacteria bacterium SCGC AAA071-K20]|nr:hypothetical protein DID80_05425 [Candidatus Marinamargulisbacteria bacterium SCGC AAA071-K20]